MLTSFFSQFKKNSKELCSNTDFINFGKTNAYVKNGMLFSFSMMKWHYKTYMIYFGVEALCADIDFIDLDHYRVEELSYDRQIETSSIDELWSYVTNYIIPFFDKCTDAQNAIYAIIDLEYQINDIRLAYLLRKGIKDCGGPIENYIYTNNQLLYLSMKALDYETMLKVVDKFIKLKQRNINEFPKQYEKYKSSGDVKYAEGLLRKAEDEKRLLTEFNEYYDRALKRDDSYFIELVQKREQESIKKLPALLFDPYRT